MGMKTRAVVRIGFGRRGSGFLGGMRGMGRVSAAYLRLWLRASSEMDGAALVGHGRFDLVLGGLGDGVVAEVDFDG